MLGLDVEVGIDLVDAGLVAIEIQDWAMLFLEPVN